MKEQIKTKKKKKELSNKELQNYANLSDAEFKTLVIRMLTEMIMVTKRRSEGFFKVK